MLRYGAPREGHVGSLPTQRSRGVPRSRCRGTVLTRLAVRQARLTVFWMNVGFAEATAKTDNLTISGETVNCGLCPLMDAYAPAAAFSSSDRGGHYAYASQAQIARWNLSLSNRTDIESDQRLGWR